jgi:serine/threonine protein kinase
MIDMDNLYQETVSDDDPLDAILASYLQAAEAGAAPDRQAFIAAHVEYRAELEEFFASQDEFEHVARPFRVAPISQSSERTDVSPGEPSNGIRYFGEYELLEEIARGGMGVVFKARQIRLNRVVALKMILSGQVASADDVRRIEVEAANTAQLDHPSIVPIYEVGQHRGQHYFTMKFISGQSLAVGCGRFVNQPRLAVRLLSQVCRAVHYAHERGILHRDIKPGNILLNQQEEPHVTDFGLARLLEDDIGLTVSGAVLGSPRYMSPEQARGEKRLTVASDVYGLGAVMYELLTGEPPFDGQSAMQVLDQVRSVEPRPPSNVQVSIDRDLETICLKCLRKEPQQRYVSALAMAMELERWLAGDPIEARLEVSEMIPADEAQKLMEFAKSLERGDFKCRLPENLPGIAGQIATALNAHCQILQTFAAESIRVMNEIGVIGKLGPQAEVPDPRGTWHNMVQSLNFLACCLTGQMRDMSQTIAAMERGEPGRRVTDTSMRGEYEEFRDRINALATSWKRMQW